MKAIRRQNLLAIALVGALASTGAAFAQSAHWDEPSQYLLALRDADGDYLSGGTSYHLHYLRKPVSDRLLVNAISTAIAQSAANPPLYL